MEELTENVNVRLNEIIKEKKLKSKLLYKIEDDDVGYAIDKINEDLGHSSEGYDIESLTLTDKELQHFFFDRKTKLDHSNLSIPIHQLIIPSIEDAINQFMEKESYKIWTNNE